MKVLNLTAAAGVAFLAMGSAATAAPLSFTDLGVIGAADTYVFDTVGSVHTPASNQSGNVDTELAIWDFGGSLLASDDDDGPGLFSEISIALTAGTYFLGISEFNSFFADDFINTGSRFETGNIADLVLNIDGGFGGLFADASDQLDQETAFFQITVGDVAAVPVPAALPLLGGGIALMGLMGWRRKRTDA
ncbi:VPLPA-CTERM sorting domain-containing protein [Octadecabacter sp.]|nr:VPLPA-CTERM sorting domain-containing protein [Octadecabacter sp.]